MSKILTKKPILIALSTIVFFNSIAFADVKNASFAEALAERKTCSTPFAEPDKNAQIVPLNKQQIANVLDSKEFFAEWTKLNQLAGKSATATAIKESAKTLSGLSNQELETLNLIALKLGFFKPEFLQLFDSSDVLQMIEDQKYLFTSHQSANMKKMISISKLKKDEYISLFNELSATLDGIERRAKISSARSLEALMSPYRTEVAFSTNGIADLADRAFPAFLSYLAVSFVLGALIGSISASGLNINNAEDLRNQQALFINASKNATLTLAMLQPIWVLFEAAFLSSKNALNYRRAAKRSAALYSTSQIALSAGKKLQKIGDTQNNYLDIPNQIKALPGKGAHSVFAESYTFKSIKNFLTESRLINLSPIRSNYETSGELALDLHVLRGQSQYLMSIAEAALTESSALGSRSCRADSLCIEHKAIINNVINTQTDPSNKTTVINDHINFAQIVLNDLIAAMAVFEQKVAHLDKSIAAGRVELQRFSSVPNSQVAETVLAALADDLETLKVEQMELSNSYKEVTEFIETIKKLR